MNFVIIAVVYAVCHGLTALVITPMQSMIIPEATVFASLLYLPHGVRVLATWAMGWRAIAPIIAGSSAATWLFTPANELTLLGAGLLQSILVGALCAFVAFELARLAGFNFYCGRAKRLNWKCLILIAAISSVINSVGQTFIFAGVIGLDQLIGVLVVYAIGDLLGLVACMVSLMFFFRWTRLYHASRN